MNFDEIQVGEVLSTTMYLTVEKVDKRSESISVKDSQGRTFDVRGRKLIEQSMNSNMQYTKEKAVTKTQLADILVGAGDCVFQVEFVKQDGTPRLLTGKLLDVENHMGRSNVHDLMIKSGNVLRQVDHRTLRSVILKGTKYNLKK